MVGTRSEPRRGQMSHICDNSPRWTIRTNPNNKMTREIHNWIKQKCVYISQQKQFSYFSQLYLVPQLHANFLKTLSNALLLKC